MSHLRRSCIKKQVCEEFSYLSCQSAFYSKRQDRIYPNPFWFLIQVPLLEQGGREEWGYRVAALKVRSIFAVAEQELVGGSAGLKPRSNNDNNNNDNYNDDNNPNFPFRLFIPTRQLANLRHN